MGARPGRERSNTMSMATAGQVTISSGYLGYSSCQPTGGAFNSRRATLDQDLAIVERCLAGEQTAWEDLVQVHTRRVYAICYRFTGSDPQAQDLTQEVF